MNEKILISTDFIGLPPTVNQMYRNVTAHGITRRYKTIDCHDFQEIFGERLKSVWSPNPPYSDRVALFIKFCQRNRRRWDIDNRVKALQDCLMIAGVIEDDSQIDFLQVERTFHSERDVTMLTLKAYEPL